MLRLQNRHEPLWQCEIARTPSHFSSATHSPGGLGGGPALGSMGAGTESTTTEYVAS
jgi:hypothetical protein